MVDVVCVVMGCDYFVLSVLVLVWDCFVNCVLQQVGCFEVWDVCLCLDGLLVDSCQLDLVVYVDFELLVEVLVLLDCVVKQVELSFDGVIYILVFNFYDGCKNWQDMISVFCVIFCDEFDVILVLKLIYYNVGEVLVDMFYYLYKNQFYCCCIVLIYGYFVDLDYEWLVEVISYVVNIFYGEG